VAECADRRVCPYQAESSPRLVGTASRKVMGARNFPATTTVPRSARRRFNMPAQCARSTASRTACGPCRSSSPAIRRRRLRVDMTQCPLKPGKALDRRRRFTLKRLAHFLMGPLATQVARGRRSSAHVPRLRCETIEVRRHAERASCVYANMMPREGRGTEAVNHFSRLPAG
jgi:hypothetical protein